MNLQKMFRNSLFISMGLLMCASCTTKDSNTPSVEETKQPSNEVIKIVFIEVDSLMTQYNFCKDFSAILESKSGKIRGNLSGKAKSLENQMKQFQAKIQANEFTSQEQYERAQTSLMKQEQELQALQQKLGEEFELEQMKYNQAMRDSIQSFLKEYNKEKKYDYILSKAGDNILLANPQHNITNEVVEGLNKRYKGMEK